MILKRKIFAKRSKPKLEKYPSYSKKQLQRMSLEDRYIILNNSLDVASRNERKILDHSKDSGVIRGSKIGSIIGSEIGKRIGSITGTISGFFKSNRDSRKSKKLAKQIERLTKKKNYEIN